MPLVGIAACCVDTHVTEPCRGHL